MNKVHKITLAAGFMLAMAFTFISCSNNEEEEGSGDGGGKSAYYGWYGSGSATSYTISTVAQLKGLANIVQGVRGDTIPPQDDFKGKTITLTADIDMSGESGQWSIGYSYLPLYPFNGTFDGSNKTISGFKASNQGFFGFIGEHGTVKNIVFTDFNLSGTDGAGGLARRSDGKVQNVGINGSIEGSSLGGLVYNNGGIVENSYFSGSISGDYDAGGVVNYNSGTVRNSYSTGSIGGWLHGTVGGVVKYNSGIVQNCYSTSNVTGGGVGGVVAGNSGTIQNCYATGSVSGESNIGVAGGITGDNENATIRNCVALNPFILNPVHEVRFSFSLGRVSSGGSFSNNYGLAEMSMQSGYNIVSDVNGKDGADITSAEWGDASWWQNTVEFPSDVWEFRDGLPILKNMPAGTQNPVVTR
jgi:hypothetical protein